MSTGVRILLWVCVLFVHRRTQINARNGDAINHCPFAFKIFSHSLDTNRAFPGALMPASDRPYVIFIVVINTWLSNQRYYCAPGRLVSLFAKLRFCFRASWQMDNCFRYFVHEKSSQNNLARFGNLLQPTERTNRLDKNKMERSVP